MARQVLDHGVIIPAEYSDDWFEDMSTNLNKLNEVIGSDEGKLSEADVSEVALSGDYDDLTNKPDLKPVATSGDYDDLTNKPDLKPVATSGDYDDLTDKPSFGVLRMTSETLSDSGSGAISNLNSDSKLAAGDYVLDAALKVFPVTAVSAPNYTVGTSLFHITNASSLAAVATSGSYDDLNNLPTYGITRFVNAAITDNSNVAFANISSVDKIKAGDFLLDNAGKMYLIASVDTANETVSVTTPLTRLALDANVVHTSGNETVGGSKTFTWPIAITSYPSIRMYISDDEWNVQPATARQSEIRFTDKNAVLISYITFQHRTDINEPFRTCWRQQKMDGTSSYFSVNFNNLGEFYPENNNAIKLGISTKRWKDCQTYQINGLTPSSLSMPTDNIANIIDISGYITVLDGSSANTYRAPDNGYIGITMNNCAGIQAYITGFWGHQVERQSLGGVGFFMPICKNMTANILIFGGTINNATFFPCQGNI